MRAFLLGVSILALGACGSSGTTNDPNDPVDPSDPIDPTDPTDPTDPPTPDESARDSDELAAVLAAHVRAEFSTQLLVAGLSEGVYPEGFSLTGMGGESGLEYTGVGASGNLTFDFTYHCNDATPEHNFVPCDGGAQHSHFLLTLSGSQSMGSVAMDDISRTVDWEIRDLMLDKARFRGPDVLSLRTSMTTEGELADYHVQFNAVYEQVRYLPAQTIPTFGTIDFTLNTERTRGDDLRVFNSIARLTYGAAGAPTTLDLDGVVYDIDLASGAVVRL